MIGRLEARCQLCGSTPAANLTIHEHNGRVIWMVHKTFKGPFCRDCGMAMFREHQNGTLLQGWFGTFSFFITPITLLLNLIPWVRLQALDEPQRDDNLEGVLPPPLNPGKPIFYRVGPYVALVVLAAFSVLFLNPGHGLGSSNAARTTSPQSTSTTTSPQSTSRPAPTRTVGGPGSSLTFTSDTGDYIGQAHAQAFTFPSWAFYANQGNLGPGGVAIDVRSDNGAGMVVWTVDLAAPPGQSLAVGPYENAMRAPFREGGRPGLDVYGDGRGCNQVFGSFTILKLDIRPDGQVRDLEATFVQRCESPTAPALNGHVSFVAAP